MQPMDPNQQMMMQNQQMGMQPMMQPGMQPMGMQPMGMDPNMQQQQNMMMMQQMQQMQNQLNEVQKAVEYKTLDKKLEDFEGGVQVKQKFEIMEALSGCEFPNVYHVYKRDPKSGKKKGDKEFKFKEKSDCWDRMWTGACKPFRMKVYNKQKVEDTEQCLRCSKPCQCEFMCCCRQEMKVYYMEKDQEKDLGKVRDPWDCMNYNFEVIDDAGNKDYNIIGSCCQIYFWCNCPCKSCNTVKFFIKQSGTTVGEVTKKGRDCLSNMVKGDDADIFDVDFPKGSNWRQRALLMCLAVFLDYVMFEDTSDQGKKDNALLS